MDSNQTPRQDFVPTRYWAGYRIQTKLRDIYFAAAVSKLTNVICTMFTHLFFSLCRVADVNIPLKVT